MVNNLPVKLRLFVLFVCLKLKSCISYDLYYTCNVKKIVMSSSVFFKIYLQYNNGYKSFCGEFSNKVYASFDLKQTLSFSFGRLQFTCHMSYIAYYVRWYLTCSTISYVKHNLTYMQKVILLSKMPDQLISTPWIDAHLRNW